MDIIGGKTVRDVPSCVYEAMFAATFHWDLEKIRGLSQREFKVFAPMVDILFRRLMQRLEL